MQPKGKFNIQVDRYLEPSKNLPAKNDSLKKQGSY